jgi:hypothetical protein
MKKFMASLLGESALSLACAVYEYVFRSRRHDPRIRNSIRRQPMHRFAVSAALAAVFISCAGAREGGQWEGADPAIRQWYRALMMPDAPSMSCCGEADAYYADSFEVGPNGEWVAIVTDDRDDPPLGRPHVEKGTRVLVPNHKLKFDEGNPTGHGVIFMRFYNDADPHHVYCYVTPGGV